MSVSSKDVRGIAKLAQIAIDDKAIDAFQRDMNAILELVDILGGYDTTDILPMAHPFGEHASQRLRSDNVTETNQCEQAMAVAPSTEANLYLVPAAIDDSRDKDEQ